MSPQLQGVLDYINAMQYPSQIRKFWRTLPRIGLENSFTPDEIDVIAASAQRRAFELSSKSIGGKVVSRSLSAKIPAKRDPDWMERAAHDDTPR
ncbi:MAG: hypothetical protein MUF85_00380 [Patescibacteria group bacterium]|nr:hypothetical protein [Patescibacteria group bacterium]